MRRPRGRCIKRGKVKSKWGHIVPGLQEATTVDFACIDRSIPAALTRLKEEFEVESGVPLNPLLKTYVSFVSKAKRYSDEGLKDESLLHYVIALELLLGERSRAGEYLRQFT